MIKMMMAAAGLSIGLLMMPVATAPAKAGVDIDINIDGGYKGRISCGRGARIVQNAGYWDVRARNCGGRYYSYFGRRNKGRTFIITVDSRRAYITDVRRIYY